MSKQLRALSSWVLVGTGAAIFNFHQPVETITQGISSYSGFSFESNEPTLLYGIPVDGYSVIEDKVDRNQFLVDILEEYNVPSKLINQVSSLPRNLFDVRKIAPDKKFTVICKTDSLKTPTAFVYEPNPVDYIVFKFEDSLWVDVCQRDVVVVEKELAGLIKTTLFETISSMGVSYELTNKFVDIFAWQVDFQRLQAGDQFKLIYEELQVEGEPIGIRQINGIYFSHFGNGYYAIPFDQGNGVDYFDENGKSLRKALLKYPIEFTRISSRYSGRRFHPVQKRYKPHLGTDFAAPRGTPIRSVGDGAVEEAQYKSGNGYYVKIRHNSTYTTQYLHMSKIASGIKRGVRVRQGQWIGNVGSTGLATGAHLCYRFWKNGRQVDALRVTLPPSQPIKPESLAAFNEAKIKVLSRLDAIPSAEEQVFASAF